MKIKKAILISIGTIIATAILGAILWLANPDALKNALIASGIRDAASSNADTIPYMQKLQKEIPVLKVVPKKKKDKREIWKVGRGVSFSNYLLRAQRHLKSFGGKVLYMEEKENRSEESIADFDFVAPFGDTFYVELQVADSFSDNTSRLAVAFYADTSLARFVPDLNKLTYPYSLLITPSEKNAEMNSALKGIDRYETVIWLPMESNELLPKNLAKASIRIHQSEAEIRDIVGEAQKILPDSKGIATRMGSRAVEQQILLRTVFASIQERGLWFWDLTNNRYSKTLEVCEELSLACRAESPFNPDRMTLGVYVANILKTARRSGKAILVIPLSTASFKAIENLETASLEQGTEIVTLSSIFQKE